MSEYNRICYDFGSGMNTSWAEKSTVKVTPNGLVKFTDVETQNRKVIGKEVPFVMTEGVELPEKVVPWDGVKND